MNSKLPHVKQLNLSIEMNRWGAKRSALHCSRNSLTVVKFNFLHFSIKLCNLKRKDIIDRDRKHLFVNGGKDESNLAAELLCKFAFILRPKWTDGAGHAQIFKAIINCTLVFR